MTAGLASPSCIVDYRQLDQAEQSALPIGPASMARPIGRVDCRPLSAFRSLVAITLNLERNLTVGPILADPAVFDHTGPSHDLDPNDVP